MSDFVVASALFLFSAFTGNWVITRKRLCASCAIYVHTYVCAYQTRAWCSGLIFVNQHARSSRSFFVATARSGDGCLQRFFVTIYAAGGVGGLCFSFDGDATIRRLLANRLDPATTMVSEVMTPHPTLARMTDSAMDCLGIMIEKHFRHLPVCVCFSRVGIFSSHLFRTNVTFG